MVLVLLLILSCDLISSDSQENYGACSRDIEEMLDFYEERGFVRILIDLAMDDFVPKHQLDEEEWREQRKEIIEFQNKFVNILEKNEIKFSGLKKGSDPWLSMSVNEKEGLLFICNHKRVQLVHHARLYSIPTPP